MPSHRYVALLRGINVGRHKRIAMADLREVVASLGHTDVTTLLQSGNVVFTAQGSAAARRPERLTAGLEAAIETRLGHRSRSWCARARSSMPWSRTIPHAAVAPDPSRYHVVFLRHPPDAGGLAAIDPAAYEPELFAVRGRELYVWMPEGVRNARLLDRLARVGPADQVATARNWNTVRKIHDLF